MLTIFYRRFYIFLFLVWLAATSALFVISVWGNFGMFVSDLSVIVATERQHDPVVTDAEGVIAQATQEVVHKAQVARDVVRREVSQDVRPVAEVVEIVEDVVEVIEEGVSNQKEPTTPPVKPMKIRQFDGAGKLTAISFTGTAAHFTAHLKTSANVGKVTRFLLKNPTRVVVDLRGKWRSGVPHRRNFADSFMHQVVIGLHPDRLRVVFRLDDPHAAINTLPELTYTDDGLDILVKNPSK